MRARLPVVAAVAVAGALVTLLATGQEWASVTVTGQAHQHVTVTGRQVSPALPALAIACIALAVAAVAARGLLRRLVGVAGLAAAVAEIVVAQLARHDVGSALAARVFGVSARLLDTVRPHPRWWWPTVVGGFASAVAFGAIAVAGGKWPGMGPRYDAPRSAAGAEGTDAAAWEALDRGDDPTA